MSAQTYNMEWQGGDTQIHEFIYKSADDQPISVASGKMQLRTTLTSTNIELEKDAIIDQITGKVSFIFDPTDTASLVSEIKPQSQYVYDTQIVTDDGRTLTLTEGSISVKLTVTRPL